MNMHFWPIHVDIIAGLRALNNNPVLSFIICLLPIPIPYFNIWLSHCVADPHWKHSSEVSTLRASGQRFVDFVESRPYPLCDDHNFCTIHDDILSILFKFSALNDDIECILLNSLCRDKHHVYFMPSFVLMPTEIVSITRSTNDEPWCLHEGSQFICLVMEVWLHSTCNMTRKWFG